MDAHIPEAQPQGPPAPEAAPHEHIPAGPPSPGAIQPLVAPPPKRIRTTKGLVATPYRAGTSSAPTLLELAAAYPMYTIQYGPPNTFVPDAQMLFHVLGICDEMMNSTDRFLRSSPAWIPIVSQLYISVLWVYMMISVSSVTTSCGVSLANLFHDLGSASIRIEECMIPGPLVPFFQSLAAINGPFDWIGDITPLLPSSSSLWNATGFHPNASFARIFPVPAILLDQLYAFSQRQNEPNQNSTYATFQWYRGIFSLGNANVPALNRIGPQLCGSLYTQQAQHDSARNFWNACLTGNFVRINAAQGQPPLNNYLQLLGLQGQNGAAQLNWFTSITVTMSKYCQFFNDSVPLKSMIVPTGLGAVAVSGVPLLNNATRDWLFPTAAMLEPFFSSRYAPRREIPSSLRIKFQHADHELEKEAEQYALVTYTNIRWAGFEPINDWDAIDVANTHVGLYWNLPPFRFSAGLNAKNWFHQPISSHYHQQAANKAE